MVSSPARIQSNRHDAKQRMAPGPAKSVLGRLWRRWQARQRRVQARYLSQVRFRLTREGVHFLAVLLFIFLGAVIRQINLLTLLAGAMIGLLILQWRFNSRTLIGLTLERQLPARARAGQTIDIRLALFNPKRLLGAWLVVIEERLQKLEPNSLKLAGKGQGIVEEVRPRGSAVCRYQLQFHERGRYRIGSSLLSTRFPLGLGRGWRTIDNSTELIVLPRLGELTPRSKKLFQQMREGHAANAPMAGTHEAEFYGLRPWQSGDSRRWIHWRTTARLGEVAVRQFERQQQRQICVLLDLHRTANNNLESDAKDACETAIEFVATLAHSTAILGSDKLAVAVAGSQLSTFNRMQSAALADQLLEALATVSPSSNPDLAEAFRSLTSALVANPVLVVVSSRGSQLSELRSTLKDPVSQKLLAKISLRWLDVSAGDIDPYWIADSLR
ncbi:MAG: DUF58 domain-containing protein [Pirellulaceae bacterium]